MRLPRTLLALSQALAMLALLAGSAGALKAAAIPYQTHGQTWPWTYGNGALPGFSGVNAIQFTPLAQGTIQPGVPFELGTFTVSPLAAGTSTVYNHSAFSITLELNPPGQTPQSGPFASISLYGALDGKVSGSDQSTVVAKVLSIQPDSPVRILDPAPGNTQLPAPYPLPFPLSALVVEPVTLAPASAGTPTPIMAVVTTLPEPSSALVALTMTSAFVVILRWRRRRGKQAQTV